MASNTGRQMDAVVMQASGPPAQALAVRSESVPVPGPGEVLVEVHAAGVNPFDRVIAAGGLGSPLPMIPGIDFAGVVVSDGDLHGQQVWGSQAYLGWKRPGTHAQFVALPRTWLSHKPGLHSHERVQFDPSEIYDHDRHVTGLASVFIDGADGAHIFDQLAALFDRGLLTPPATKTWPLEGSVEAYQRVQDGAHGIKQVLLPTG